MNNWTLIDEEGRTIVEGSLVKVRNKLFALACCHPGTAKHLYATKD